MKLEFLLVVFLKCGNDVLSHVVKINDLISGHVFQIEFTSGQAIFRILDQIVKLQFLVSELEKSKLNENQIFPEFDC